MRDGPTYMGSMRRLLVNSACVLTMLGCDAVSATRDGRVSGSIRLCGGPAPGRCVARDGTVSVLDRHDRVVATETTAHARFSFTLPAGSYTLVASTAGVRAQRPIRIRAERTLRADVVIGGLS